MHCIFSFSVLYLCIPTFVIIGVMMGFNGLLLTVYYRGCDPLSSGKIERADQVTQVFVITMYNIRSQAVIDGRT